MCSPDILDIVPEHVADPVRRAPWRARLLTACGDGLLSLLLNGLVVGGMIDTGWPLSAVQAPQAISVELVDHMPGSNDAGAAVSREKVDDVSKSAPATERAATPVQQGETQAKVEPPRAAPEVKAEPRPEPKPKPAATTPEADAATVADAVKALAPDVQATTPATTPPPARVSDQPPTPPPSAPATPEHPDNTPDARLVEAPMAPPPAPIMDETKPATAVSPPPAQESFATAPEPRAEPPVQTTPEADADAVPPPSPPPKPLTAEQRRQAENTAQLAAMLPFGSNIAADPFRGQAANQGQGSSTAYRGQVYANFNKAQDVIADAKARNLKGQAVIAFTVDAHGGLAAVGVAVSSGNPAVDQAALELIRRAAPFPPPPPGAPRSFSPAIGLGLDE